MSGLLRKLGIYICSPIYKLISDVYYIFYNLANTRFLNSEIISQFSSNIYVLVSVVMLFAFSIVILSTIVNPELLNDSKKGVTALFKRSIIALFLMVLVPFMFNMLYKIQAKILDNALIEKIIVGTNISCQEDTESSGNSSTTDAEDDSESKCKSGGNGGQVIAGTLISSIVYPIEDNISVDEDVQKSYEAMIAEDIKHIGNFAEHINATTDGEDAGWLAGMDTNYAFVFNGMLGIACGFGCVYILLLYSFDIAIRVFKLAFMELTAPISIVGYIAAGNKILSSWFQELIRTYVDLFIRIAAIAFYLLLLSNLSSFLEPFTNKSWGLVLKALLIIGMLVFVKQIPDMIKKVFGVEFTTKGGLKGRYDEAKKAIQSVVNPVLSGGAAVGSAVGATGRRIREIAKNENRRAALLKDKGAGRGRRIADRAGTAIGGLLTTPLSTARAFKSGLQNKNLHAIGEEAHRYEDSHPEGSTLGGRAYDTISQALGGRTRLENRNRELDKMQKEIEARELKVKDQEADINNSPYAITINGKTRNMTKQDMEFEKNNRTAFNDAMVHSIEKNDSQVTTVIDGVKGNYHQLSEHISSLRQNGPVLPDKSSYTKTKFDQEKYEEDVKTALEGIKMPDKSEFMHFDNEAYEKDVETAKTNGTEMPNKDNYNKFNEEEYNTEYQKAMIKARASMPDKSNYISTEFDEDGYNAAVEEKEKEHFEKINKLQKELAEFRKTKIDEASASVAAGNNYNGAVSGEDLEKANAAKESLENSLGVGNCDLGRNRESLKEMNNSIIVDESRRTTELHKLDDEKIAIEKEKDKLEKEKREREYNKALGRAEYTTYGKYSQDSKANDVRRSNNGTNSNKK